MIRLRVFGVLSFLMLFLSCSKQSGNAPAAIEESREAKALMQGIWIDSETENVIFRVKGDTIFYPDTISQPSYFRIVDDTIEIGRSQYQILKQAQHVFWFRNQSNDVVKLQKSSDPADSLFFTHTVTRTLPVITDVVKKDSVVFYKGERYHWYIAINPTKILVSKTSYSHDGMESVTNYYDNIIHVSVFQGDKKLYSSNIKKAMYKSYIPETFLTNSILGDMQFNHVDDNGFHFNTTICDPEGTSCYLVSTDIGFDGSLNMELLDY